MADISFDWNLDTFESIALPDNLYIEIQSAVNAAAQKLAKGNNEEENSKNNPDENIAFPVEEPISNKIIKKDNTGRTDLLLIMEVVIGDGRTETIEVHNNDIAENLANIFASKHGLADDVIPTLIEHIKQQVNEIETSNSVQKSSSDRINAKNRPSFSEAEKEMQYNSLLGKYGQYSSHNINSGTQSFQQITPSKAIEMNIDFTAKQVTMCKQSSTKSKRTNIPPACQRLHALAEARENWRQRARKAKEEEAQREIEKSKIQMAEKSKEIVANRTNGKYRTIGDRLYSEALIDFSRKTKLSETKQLEREEQFDWMCPNCAYTNMHSDLSCKNPFAVLKAKSKDSANCTPDEENNILCGQPKPDMFRPTLLANKNAATKKGQYADVTIMRRKKHQQMARENYNQTYTFKPKLNSNSKDIVREKRIKTGKNVKHDPHDSLYEDALVRRLKQQEKEQAYVRQFPFKPDIGVNSLRNTGEKSLEEFYHRIAIEDQNKLEAVSKFIDTCALPF